MLELVSAAFVGITAACVITMGDTKAIAIAFLERMLFFLPS
ncbi:hypothetical protein [Niallia sp. FSL R7-0271]